MGLNMSSCIVKGHYLLPLLLQGFRHACFGCIVMITTLEAPPRVARMLASHAS